MTSDQVGRLLLVAFSALMVLSFYRWFRPPLRSASLSKLSSQGIDVSMPPDSFGAGCTAGFEFGSGVLGVRKTPCHLWVHHGYIALVPEGERVAIALRRCDIKQVRWTTMTLRMKMSPDSMTIARLRFQVQGGDWLSRQFMTSGSTIQLFDAIAEADLPLAIQ